MDSNFDLLNTKFIDWFLKKKLRSISKRKPDPIWKAITNFVIEIKDLTCLITLYFLKEPKHVKTNNSPLQIVEKSKLTHNNKTRTENVNGVPQLHP